MNKYILDEDGNELEGVIGCDEDGYIFEDGYIKTTKIKCLNCGGDEGTLLKEFQENPEKNYSWYDLAMMTEVCASCGSENIKTESEVS